MSNVASPAAVEPTTENLIIGSDGSLHIHEQVAAAAWIISTGDTKHLSATFLMTNISSYTSHRIELEGIFRALHHLDLLNITPKMVEQWCDNEQAVKDSSTTPAGPSMMIKAEADIILAIHHLRNRFPFHTNIKHIYGHQDTRKSKRHIPQDKNSQPTKEVDTPSNNPQANPPFRTEPFLTNVRDPQQSLPIEVQINIACDGIATETTRIALGAATPPIHQTILTPPYDGSRAMLKIGKTWITAHYKKAIYDAHRTPAMTAYMIDKYPWTADTIKTVNWESIKSVRRSLSDTKKMQTCKIMHGWLPLGHMRHHITGINQCPGCTSTNETIDHMLKCPHPTITEKREVVLSQMLVKGKQNKIPKGVLTAFIQLLTKYTTGATDYTLNTHSRTIQDAIAQQMAIGVDMMARGYIGIGWKDTVPTARHPTRILNKLQCMVWMDFFKPLWQNRNELLHQQKNNYETAENAALTEQLMWYQYNRHTLLAHHDHALLHNIDMATLHTMPSRHKREWIRHLTVAKLANTQELALKKTNQHSLFRYMKPVNAQPTTNPGTQPPQEKPDPPPRGRPSKLKVSHSTNSHDRVHRQRFQPGKTPERRQRTVQGIPRYPQIDLYDHHNRGHTTRTSVAPTAVREKPAGGILIPMHPFPD